VEYYDSRHGQVPKLDLLTETATSMTWAASSLSKQELESLMISSSLQNARW
jgi:hypothetical protein